MMKSVRLGCLLACASACLTGCPDGTPTGEPPFCGGIAGIPCPGAGLCIDDPRDDCDPKKGGADCSGICECKAKAKCEANSHWDPSPSVCGCVSDVSSCAAILCIAGTDCVVVNGKATCVGGEKCGNSTCGPGRVCCNPSCGLCAPPDGACIQIACD